MPEVRVQGTQDAERIEIASYPRAVRALGMGATMLMLLASLLGAGCAKKAEEIPATTESPTTLPLPESDNPMDSTSVGSMDEEPEGSLPEAPLPASNGPATPSGQGNPSHIDSTAIPNVDVPSTRPAVSPPNPKARSKTKTHAGPMKLGGVRPDTSHGRP